jgi:hypothetical protein
VRNRSFPSWKKGRLSGYCCRMVVLTLIWSASASIWLKSGFTTASSVTALDGEYLAPSEGSALKSSLSSPDSGSSGSAMTAVW